MRLKDNNTLISSIVHAACLVRCWKSHETGKLWWSAHNSGSSCSFDRRWKALEFASGTPKHLRPYRHVADNYQAPVGDE